MARRILERAVIEAPDCAPAHTQLGYLLLLVDKKPEQAVEEFLAASKLSPDDEAVIMQIGYILDIQGRKAEAYEQFSKLADSKNPETRRDANRQMGYYLLLEEKKPAEALPHFEIASELAPDDEPLVMQTGYILVSIGRKSDAYLRFRQVSGSKDPALRREAHLQMAYYLLLEEHLKEAALRHFEAVHELDPGDESIVLQIAYLLDDLGRRKEAYDWFLYLSHSTNSKVRRLACTGLNNLAYWVERKWQAPYFGELYLAPQYTTRFDNAVFPFNFNAGIARGDNDQLQAFIGLRGSRDTRSRSGTVPVIFSENSLSVALGARYKLFPKSGVDAYFEQRWTHDLINSSDNGLHPDARVGLTYSGFWGAGPSCPAGTIFPFDPVGSAYADLGFYSRDGDNIVGYARIQHGWRVAEHRNADWTAYGFTAAARDNRDHYYNNFINFGAGLTFVPGHRSGLTFRIERTWGTYLRRELASENPFGKTYNDTNVAATYYDRF
ncbi:MAG: tetratricopeptide repeat protein [bacterium]